MSVFETYYLLFKSNAADAVKGNKQVEKSSKELKEELNKTRKEADELGKNFVKVAENATAAMTAFFSLGAIKSGILDTAKFNSNLEVQGKLLDQNAREMLVWGSAVKAAGGSFEGFQSALQGAFTAASNAGLPLPPVEVLMRRYREAVKGLSKNEQARRLGMLGVSDPGMMSLLTQSDDEFEKSIAAAREHARVTEVDTAAAREFEKAWSQAADSLQSLFTTVGSDILPAITSVTKSFTEFTDHLKNDKLAMYEFFGGMIALATTAAGAVGKLAASLVSATGAASAGGWLFGLSRKLGIAGFAVGGLPLIAEGSYAAGQGIGHWMNRLLGRGDSQGNINPHAKSNAQDAMAFYMSQGYTRAQAAGIVANEQRESGGDPAARGDGGKASGLYQWHPDRVKAIKEGTGIDVTTASAEDQRRAAVWEMKHSGFDAKLRATDDPNEAARRFSLLFERPANGVSEAMIRGKMAMRIANETPFSASGSGGMAGAGDKTVSIKIDEINVHTQATDAGGISRDLSDQLNTQLRTTVANFDDGIAR